METNNETRINELVAERDELRKKLDGFWLVARGKYRNAKWAKDRAATVAKLNAVVNELRPLRGLKPIQ